MTPNERAIECTVLHRSQPLYMAMTAFLGFVVVAVVAIVMERPEQQAIIKAVLWSLLCVLFGGAIVLTVMGFLIGSR